MRRALLSVLLLTLLAMAPSHRIQPTGTYSLWRARHPFHRSPSIAPPARLPTELRPPLREYRW